MLTTYTITTWRKRVLPSIIQAIKEAIAPRRQRRSQRAKPSKPLPMYRGKS